MPNARKNGDDPADRELYVAVGLRIRELRERREMTQRRLAELSEVRATYLNEVEVLGVNLSLKLLQQIATALGVLPRDLLPSSADESETSNVTLGVVRRKLEGLRKTVDDGHEEILKALNEIVRFLDTAAASDEGEAS
jgi:transcriptional regulator with XRE-family HTH domain